MATERETVPARTEGAAPEEPDSRPETEADEEGVVPARDPAWGARVVMFGIGAVVISLALAVAFFNDSARDVIAITGPAFAVISGLVAAYFGIRAGSLAGERIQGAVAGKPPPGVSEKRQKELMEKRGGAPPRRRGLRGRDRGR